MTEYAFTTTVHCGHDGCQKTAYHETGSHYIAYQVRKRQRCWYCDEHISEQGDMNFQKQFKENE